MESSTSLSSPDGSATGTGALRQAAQWWEPRRIPYNIILAAVFVGLTARTWPRLQPDLNSSAVAPLIVLALLANLCYSFAYVVDLPVQEVREPRARNRWRWTLWSVGMAFAMLFETYWFLDEILPPIQ